MGNLIGALFRLAAMGCLRWLAHATPEANRIALWPAAAILAHDVVFRVMLLAAGMRR